MILLAIVLGAEGAAGSAVAGLYIEGDMNSLTAVLLVIIAMGCTFGFTVAFIFWLASEGKKSKRAVIRAFAKQLFRDVKGASPLDPMEELQELNQNVKTLVGQNVTLIEWLAEIKASKPTDRWEKPL